MYTLSIAKQKFKKSILAVGTVVGPSQIQFETDCTLQRVFELGPLIDWPLAALAMEPMQSPRNESGVGQHAVDVGSGDFLGVPLPYQFLAGADPAEAGQCVRHSRRPVERVSQVVRQECFLSFVFQYGGMGVVGDAEG